MAIFNSYVSLPEGIFLSFSCQRVSPALIQYVTDWCWLVIWWFQAHLMLPPCEPTGAKRREMGGMIQSKTMNNHPIPPLSQ